MRANPIKKQFFSDRWRRIDYPHCSGSLRRICFDRLIIGRAKLETGRYFERSFEINEHCVVLYFILEGSPTTESNRFPGLTLKSGTHNIAHMPPLRGLAKARRGNHEIFFIRMPLALFKNYFPKHKKSFACFSDRIEREQFSILRQEHGVIDHQIYKIIEDICQCDQDEDLKKIYLKAKVIELMSLQLAQLCTQCTPICSLKKGNMEKMYTVRDFIGDHIGEYHSLKDLAKRVGTNEFTLKTEFKELFGLTVFGYWHNVKMEQGQRLLMERKKSIKQISEEVGYKNPQHFSTAFKKKYGMSPTMFQKNINWKLDKDLKKTTKK